MSDQSRIEDWVRAAQSDDVREADAARAHLVREFQPQLVGFLRGRACRLEDAEDVALDTLAKAFKSIRSCRPDHFRAWLWKIAMHNLLDLYRWNGRRIRTTTLNEHHGARLIDASVPAPEAECERTDILSLLRREVGSLPRRERQVITLCFDRGLSMKEIAQKVGWSAKSTASAHVHRIITELERRLSARAGGAIGDAWLSLAASGYTGPGPDIALAATQHIVGGNLPEAMPIPDAEECDRLAGLLRGRHAQLRDLVINSNPDTILRAHWLLRFLGMTALYPVESMSSELREIHRFMTEHFGDRDVPGDLGLTIELSFFSDNEAPALDDCLGSDPADWTERMTPVTRSFAQFSGLPTPTETDPHGAVELFARWNRVVRHGRPITAALVALHLMSIARRVASFPEHRVLADMFATEARTFRDRIQTVSNGGVAQRWIAFSELTRQSNCQVRV